MTRRSLLLSVTALFLAVSIPITCFGQALADRVPADSIIYVGWQGADSPGPGYDNSNLKAVLAQTQFSQFCNEFLPKLLDRAAQENRDAADAVAAFRAVAGPMWRHPSAFFFAGVDLSNPQQPVPHLGIISQAGDESGDLERQVRTLLRDAGNAPFPIRVARVGDVVALTVGYEKPEAALAGGQGNAKPLSGDENFTKALGQVNKDAFITGYVNVEALLDTIDKAVQQAAPQEAQQMWPKIESALGARSVKRAIWTEGFEGKEWGARLFVAVPEPRQGLVALLDNAKPLSDDIYKTIPQNVRLAGASRFDLAALVNAIRDAAAKVHPDAGQMIDNVFEQISQTVGVDVRKDLFGSLGDEWAYYLDPAVLGRGMLGTTLVNRLKDPTKAEQSIVKVQQFISEQADEALKDKKISINFRETRSGNVTIHYLAIPIVTPSWAVHDGNLYVGLYPQVVGAAVNHATSQGKTILDNAAFVAMRDRLDGKNAASIQFMDLPRLVPDNYGTWLAISQLNQAGELFGVSAPPMLLPTLDKIMPYLSPGGEVSWVEADGLHVRAISPFPGAELLASDPTGFMGFQAMGVLLPALEKARAQAERQQARPAPPAAPAPRRQRPRTPRGE